MRCRFLADPENVIVVGSLRPFWVAPCGRNLRQLSLAIGAGALSAYGEPRPNLAPLFLLGLIALAFLTARAATLALAGLLGVGYGAALFSVIMISSASWGLLVPIALTGLGVALYGVPLALWIHFASRRLRGALLFCSTMAAWALCMDLGDAVGFPSKCEALSAVAFAPVLLGGCRLFGANLGGGILLVPKLRERFLNHAKLTHQAILLTSYLLGTRGGGLNAVAFIDHSGKLRGVHRKVDLAPFDEVELEHGAGFHAFSWLKSAKVGVLICQEALLSTGPRALVRDGATMLVTTTSDVSFGSGILSFGHLPAARLRAIEVGRDMVWASNAGPSGAISRWGEFRAAAPFRQASAASMRIESFADASIYLGSPRLWPTLSVVLLLLTLRARSRPEACADRGSRPSALRGVLEFALSLARLVLATFASPVAVELSSGSAPRARQAVLELIGRAEPQLGPESLARFHTDRTHSAQGALAFYLDYYGDRRLPSSFALSPSEPTLSDLSRELTDTEHFPTREVRLDFQALPRASATSEEVRRWLFMIKPRPLPRSRGFFGAMSEEWACLRAQINLR